MAQHIYECGVTEQSEVKNTRYCLLLWKQRPVMRYSYPRVCVIWAFLTVLQFDKQTREGKLFLNAERCFSVNEPQQAKLNQLKFHDYMMI